MATNVRHCYDEQTLVYEAVGKRAPKVLRQLADFLDENHRDSFVFSVTLNYTEDDWVGVAVVSAD